MGLSHQPVILMRPGAANDRLAAKLKADGIEAWCWPAFTITLPEDQELVAQRLAHLDDVDMVVLPGGIPGTPNLAANKTVTDTCVSFAKSGKKVAAICAAPSVLASLGLLEGRKATAHAGFQDKLAGAEVLDTEVVVDGNITTSYGLGGAIPFALELVRQLAGQAEADRIRNAIAYRH